MYQTNQLTNPNSMNRLPLWRGLFLIPVLLVCFALAPSARAVVPAPDGGYPGSNTAEGTQALFSRTTGVWNTALGFQALYHDTSGNANTATGFRALFNNVNGIQNTATGVLALFSNTSGVNNTANGWGALTSNTTGRFNAAFGVNALRNNNADSETAVGFGALAANTSGGNNVAVGYQALRNNVSNSFSTAVGWQADLNSTGNSNDAFGYQALSSVTTGAFNVGIGVLALNDLTTGISNVAVGNNAGNGLTTGNGNVYIGQGVPGVGGESNTTRIKNVYASVASARVVYVNSDNKIGTLSSSRRYKEEIKPMEQASESILALKPVTFRYKQEFDGSRAPMFGLIAEEVEKINPDLVSRDEKGEVETVRYDAINAMLLNEFIKEHGKVTELQATVALQKKDFAASIAQQQKEIKLLTAGLKEQAAQIQKVSARLEARKPAPQVVANQ
jgi:hypothetical protein